MKQGIDVDKPRDFGRACTPAMGTRFTSMPSYTEALLDPGSVFEDPVEISDHPRLTDQEKRTLLLSWARDALVLEHVANKSLPELKPCSRIDRIIDVLSGFDPQAAAEYRSAVASMRAQRRQPAERGFRAPRG